MRISPKHIVLIFLISTSGISLIAQSWQPSIGVWKFKSISGEMRLEGIYGQRSSLFNDIPEEQNSGYFIGGLSLNTNSYLWQPDIITFNIDGEYNPETRQEKYLSLPDRAEVRTLKKLNFRTSIFNNKKLSIVTFINLHQNYFNRENLTNIQSDNKQWGANVSFRNKYLPLNASFKKTNWEQTETETGRTFLMNQSDLQLKTEKSFYQLDKHTLTYMLNDYKYNYTELASTNNTINRISLNDQFYFSLNKNYSFNSNINFHDQRGSHKYSKIEANERLDLQLPYHIRFKANYYFYKMMDENYTIVSNRIRSALRHQLFESLNSEIYIDVPLVSHDLYQEKNIKTGGDLKYTKKIPFGRINLGYHYYRHYNTTNSDQSQINIVNEKHSLSSFDGLLLDRPYVNINSIIITDISGSIYYEEGLDYLITELNNYIEISRIPGGLIEDDQEVYINYTAIQPQSYSYVANNNTFNTSLSILGNLLEIYYRTSSQKYKDPVIVDFLSLNQYKQHVVGGKFSLSFASGGVEYDAYNSNLIPYKKINYFLQLNFKIKDRFLISLNSNYKDYKLLNAEIDHKYTNISARIAYNLSRKSKINLQAGYLNQNGRNIDLNLLSARVEFVANHRKVYLKTGLNIYNRSYINNEYDYLRSYIKLTRKF